MLGVSSAQVAELSWRFQQLSGATTFALTTAAAILFALLTRCSNSDSTSVSSSHKPIPRPASSLPFLYDTFAILKHGKQIHTWVARQNELIQGRTWRLQIPGDTETVVINTPELIKDILVTHFENFGKGELVADNFRDLLGEGIFAVDGLKWVHQRKTASNLFSNRDLRDFMELTVKQHVRVLTKILQQQHTSDGPKRQQPIDMFRLFNRFTFEVFAEIGFGVKMGALDEEQNASDGNGGALQSFQSAFDDAQRLIANRFMVPRWFWKTQRYLNVGAEKELKSCITVIDDVVFDIISQSMTNRENLGSLNSKSSPGSNHPGRRKDIVSLFLDHGSNDTKPNVDTEFDPKFLRDIVVNFLIAGRDTTAQTLSWFMFCLSQNPCVERKICEELATELPGLDAGGGSEGPLPSMEKLHLLVYLEAAIKETLRLYPSVSDNTKQCLKDTLLCDGTFIKAGTYIAYPGYSLGRMTHVWGPDAKEFKPERWIDRDTGKLITVSAYKFNSFHAGPRMCLGMNLAMMEIKMVAAVLLSKFRFSLVPGQNITYEFSLTLPIKGALMMNVTPNVPPSN